METSLLAQVYKEYIQLEIIQWAMLRKVTINKLN
jgi:hypothetical protein